MLVQTPLADAIVGASPFDDPERADLAVRTTDNRLLFVYKAHLVEASPFFASLLSDDSADGLEKYKGLPVFSVFEDNRTMHFILRLCSSCAITVAELLTVATECPITDTLDKYLMEAPQERIADIIREAATSSLLAQDPLCVFGLARMYRMPDLALEAARQTLNMAVSEWPSGRRESLRALSGLDYQRLVRYHDKCGQVAVEAAGIELKPWGTCFRCDSSSTVYQYLHLGRRGFAIDLYNKNVSFSYEDMLKFAAIGRIGEMFRNRPGRKVSAEEIELICGVAVSQCGGTQWEVRAAIQWAVDRLQEDVDLAISRVPLSLE
ncbi:hypothetical protein CYLTODRAFT_454540 [Cylindrobasidium torrendii FP15055 ss-10]|uniref:BTB domain-containing protein n=1 Tax=Cylindrobasidium torrendii FP15055 ss-10 TaxID=1314674 RepID=A0A0D7BA14_9AGAR|nr:hypothetical protein CYLTODRAFT_454540 [Cylindrobasidium torrendii FP15055 ss-10]